ncbi:signal peptidase I [Halorientalis marina]|jgi:signal peptidase|uniref:signal peptidase I n=1 Tax=Halorientalis marina TaxID=2931976 RepID=UPI001FF19909|nr:signal peptidase I [Halorientalis marina]
MNLHTAGTVLALVAIAPFLVFAVPSAVGASHSYVVLSSSMSPTIHAGDVVFVEDVEPEGIEEGDVVTFDPERGTLAEREKAITHRVIEVQQRSDGRYFVTKGDANDSPDATPVAAENVVGRVTFQLPLIGHAIVFVGTDLGILLLVVLPAGLLAVTELRDLLRAATDESTE